MDSLHCEVQYVNVFSVWCSNFSSRGGLLEKKNERARKRSWQREQENEKWAQVGPTSAFTSCLFQKGGRGEKEGWLQCRGGVEENKCKMKAFLEATKELYTGKGLGSPQWDWRTHRQNLGRKKACLTMPPGPMLGSKSQSEKQKEEESERQNGNDGPAGKYSSRSSKGGGWYICWSKGHHVFSAIHLKTNCTGRHSQTASGCGVDFVSVFRKKKKPLKKRTTDSPCVAPCYKSGQKAVKNNKENRWERKWVWTGDTRVMMSYQCCSDVNNPVIVDELKSTRSRTSRHLFLCKLTATVQIHFKAVLLMFNWLFIQYLAFELYQSKWIVLVS